MKVAHVAWLTVVGGGELFALDLIRALQGRGVEQELYCLGPGGPPLERARELDIRVERFDKRGKLGLGALGRLAAALRRSRPDIVQAHGEAGIFWGLGGALLARVAPSCALVYQVRPEAADKTFAMRRLLPRAEAVVAGSFAVRGFLVDEVGVDPARVEVIHCGIDTARFGAARRAPHATSTTSGGPLLVTVGRMVEQKGHSVLLTAFARLLERVGDAELRIVGDGPLLPTLRRRARELGIAHRVRFPGTIYPTTAALADADLFVFPSLFEPQGLALLEALAAGIPVVASETGGIVEMIDDGSEGRLVEPGDPAALADAIAGLLADPALLAGCGRRARERAAAFDIGVVAARYETLYASLATGR